MKTKTAGIIVGATLLVGASFLPTTPEQTMVSYFGEDLTTLKSKKFTQEEVKTAVKDLDVELSKKNVSIYEYNDGNGGSGFYTKTRDDNYFYLEGYGAGADKNTLIAPISPSEKEYFASIASST